MKIHVVNLLLVQAFVCTMAVSDFLVTKWKDWYKSVDVNHDGIVSVADFEKASICLAGTSLLSCIHLDSEKLEKVLNNFDEWWNVCILKGQAEISEEQFVDDRSKEYTTNKAKFHEKMQKCYSLIFHVLDTNDDGSISVAKFVIAFREYNHGNVAEEVKLFMTYDPKDGLVPVKDMVDSWVDFTTSEDSSNPSVVKDELEAGA